MRELYVYLLSPDSYDDMYLYGIGRIDSEFRADQAPEVAVKLGVDISSEEGKAEMIYAPCIEIMLSDEPREEERIMTTFTRFG